MMIPKGDVLELGKRGSFREIIKDLSGSGFSGYLEVSYKNGELSKGKVLFSKGKIVAAGIQRIISKKEVTGSKALEELLGLESCVADVYTLSEDNVAKALEWNKSSIVEELPEEEKEIEDGLSEEVIVTPSEREKILEKYSIKVPSEEEIDQIIVNALEDYEDVSRSAVSEKGDFELLKKSLEEIAESYLGKLSRKVVNVINSCSSTEELVEKFPEIASSAKSLVMFVPRKKIEEMLSEMERIVGENI